MTSPPGPLSCQERGKRVERGLRPLSLRTPAWGEWKRGDIKASPFGKGRLRGIYENFAKVELLVISIGAIIMFKIFGGVFMTQRYPALHMVASLLKTIAILFVIIGMGASFWFLFQGDSSNTTRLITIGGILISIIYGVIIYALSDFFRCIMDIEANTRAKTNATPPVT